MAIALIGASASTCVAPQPRLLDVPPTAPLAAPSCAQRSGADYYFAPGQIDPSRDDAFLRNEWFGFFLRLAKAESLSCGESREAYRVLWMPSFRNARIMTIALVDRKWTLTIVDFGDRLFRDWKRGESPAQSIKPLSDSEVRRIREEFTAANFWFSPPYRDNRQIDDGIALVVEGRSGDRYRALTRINQWDGTERVACLMFDISGLTTPEYPGCPKPAATTR